MKASIPSKLNHAPAFKYTYNNYIDELTLKLQKSRILAKDYLIRSKFQNKSNLKKKVPILISKLMIMYLSIIRVQKLVPPGN